MKITVTVMVIPSRVGRMKNILILIGEIGRQMTMMLLKKNMMI